MQPGVGSLKPGISVLALHQDYGNAGLWKFATDQGFEVVRGDAFETFLALYAATGGEHEAAAMWVWEL